MSKILVLHGPNLNLLGKREPACYGSKTLQEINDLLHQEAAEAEGIELESRQTNSESELIGWIQQAHAEGVEYIVINPAAFTHTSIALRDALLASGISFVEVHLSNIHAREEFRHKSCISDIAKGTITGFGPAGYVFAVHFAIDGILEKRKFSDLQ